ncbi:MAG: response regulator [Gammaproteobacteria bacterium]|nr:response regulator [Gammaproteobacteria bacterium]
MAMAQRRRASGESNLLFNGPNLSVVGKTENDDVKSVKRTWKVLIVDDDDVVHQVTSMVLSDYSFEGEPVQILKSYSGFECRRIMQNSPDIAVVIMDVVMETDTAGLDAIKYIREELGNHSVRIIVRTGQPGQLPEKIIVAEYDINGYLEKADLTAAKLYDNLDSSLQAYKEINNL